MNVLYVDDLLEVILKDILKWNTVNKKYLQIILRSSVFQLELPHNEEISKKKYHEELDFLVGCNKRNAFIRNLAVSLEGNTLVLFQYVEKHGNLLHEIIKNKVAKGRKVFYVYGGTDTELRENVRAIVESEKDAIIVASYGVYSTGVNIKNLHNIIFAHPGKSKIRVLQSIGRGLRINEGKEVATLYDIVDDLSYKAHKNFAHKHFLERYKFYREEKFPVKIYKVDFADG